VREDIGMVHRDIHAHNIMLQPKFQAEGLPWDDYPTFILIDFGRSGYFDPGYADVGHAVDPKQLKLKDVVDLCNMIMKVGINPSHLQGHAKGVNWNVFINGIKNAITLRSRSMTDLIADLTDDAKVVVDDPSSRLLRYVQDIFEKAFQNRGGFVTDEELLSTVTGR
jgi:hypothetical protein